MLRRLPLLVAALLLACGGGRIDGNGSDDDGGVASDGGSGDAGHVGDGGAHDGGTTDSGNPPVDGGTEPDAGPPPPDAGTTLSLDLFEIKGTVATGQVFPATVNVQLLTPFVSVTPNAHAHAFDNRQDGIGCYADHYDGSHPPLHDAADGEITISGFKGGSFLPSGHSTTPMLCDLFGGSYACSYTPFSASKPAATQPYSDTTNPLGGNTITFSNTSTGSFGTFSVSGSATTTLTSSGLGSLHFSASADTTVQYSCSANCTSSLVLVTLAASRNAANAVPSTNSASFGAATCAAPGSTSITIPKEAIAAMLNNDSALKSVLTSVVVTTPPSAPSTDSVGNPINVLVGRGAFGISSL
jgi:hypothetical protein